MSAAVMSPLGTMSSSVEEEEVSPLFGDKDMAMQQDDEVSVPSLFDDNDYDVTMEETPEQKQQQSFGGLNNLGNTCYLASGLQMLASLDRFNITSEDTPPQVESTLRQEFLELLERLRNGETVNPEAFKGAVDARSPLFVGYRQQDSHEFLTTLLDLLDEDYNTKPDDDDETMDDQQVEEKKTEEEKVSTDETVTESEPADDLVAESKVEAEPRDMCADMNAPPLRRSLSELQMEDISDLLHGQGPPATLKEAPLTTSLPQCKLVGGRAIVAPMAGVTPLKSVDELNDDDDTPAALPDTSPATDGDQGSAYQQEEERDPSPIEEYFTTEVRARLTCDSCKYTRSHVEKYLHLSLDISSDSGSVEEGLRKFFAPEKREVKCEKCFCESATQTLSIVKLPQALLVHCKRFIVDVSPDYSSVSYRKNQSPFCFGDILNDDILGEFLAPELPRCSRRDYRIRSVVNHIGSSASCGHYTADALRLYSSGERQWTRFNDSRVSQISEDNAMGQSAQKTAYMVMYELN